jgi:hypothetical protein
MDNTLKLFYVAYFYSILKYGIIFGVHLAIVPRFSLYKIKIIRIMAGAEPRTSCTSLFKQRFSLFHANIYTLSSMNFNIDNQDNFQTNSSTHNINTSNKHHPHRPNANLSSFQKKRSTFYAGIRIFQLLTT